MNDTPLMILHRELEAHYKKYISGEISEKEYLEVVKPIDDAIGKLEMAMLRCTPVLEKSSSELSRSQKSLEETA